MRDTKLEISLLILRLSIAAFLLVWALDKIIIPEHARAVFAKFYLLSNLPLLTLKLLGVAQVAVILVFAIGLAKTWSYGAIFIMHAVSTVSTYPHIIHPFSEGRQLLFWAAVPVLAATLSLFLLRDRDRLLTISSVGRS